MNKLNGKKINALLRETFEQHTPDCADQIIRAASGKNAAPTVSVVQEPSRISYIRRGAAIAVAAALIFSLIAAAIVIRNNEPYATVTVESDVCVAISLNRAYKPIEIRAESASAEPIVQNIAESHTLEDSVDSILDRMLENGNLSEESNTVLITANAPENADALLNAAYAAAKKSFEESRYRGAILTAVASHDEDILDLARRYHISVGKAVLVAEIHNKEQRYDAKLLSRLSVNDLNLLTTYRRIRYERIGIYGVSRSGMTPDDAIALAKENAGMDDATASVTVDLGDSGLIYCVSVRSGNHVYQCCMNAGSGDVIGVTDESNRACRPDRTAGSRRADRAEARPDCSPAHRTGSQPLHRAYRADCACAYTARASCTDSACADPAVRVHRFRLSAHRHPAREQRPGRRCAPRGDHPHHQRI